MPTLSALYIYPIKSCSAIALEQAQITPWGLEWDRHWMLVDLNGRFLSQRRYPVMARIVPSFSAHSLVVSAPGVSSLNVPLDAEAIQERRSVTLWKDRLRAFDEGVAAADWFSGVMGVSVRLVRFDATVRRLASKHWTGGVDAATQFADGFPFLVTAQASLDELNARLVAKGAPAIPMNRFRPNLVLSGLDAYDEDRIDTLVIDVDERIALRLVKPCARCSMPTIDQILGARNRQWPREPLDTMASYRANPRVGGGLTFGQNALIVKGEGQALRLGMKIRHEWSLLENV